MLELKNKNILIIMPQFYTYQAQIKADLDSRGANYHIYDEEPPKTKFLVLKNIESLTKWHGVYNSFNRKLLGQIMAEAPEEGYDYFLTIRGNVLTPATIEAIKSSVLKKDAKTIYYAWDSFENMRHNGTLGELFDKAYTFDSVDAKIHDKYNLLPLFYSDDFDGAKLPHINDYEYDYVSVSAFFPFRYRYFKAFKEANPDLKLCLKIYFNPEVYKAKKIKNPSEVADLDMDIVSFTPFSPQQIRDMCLKSRAVLDLAHEKQQGLTMRTMETLGIRRKLVTNNIYLPEYEFYNENNCQVLEDLAIKCDAAEVSKDYSAFELPGRKWLDAPYQENEAIREKYSIHSWLDNLFS